MILAGRPGRPQRKTAARHAPAMLLSLFAFGLAEAARDCPRSLEPDRMPDARAPAPDAPPALPKTWGAGDIAASRVVEPGATALPGIPLFKADPLNLTLVFEQDGEQLAILDGDSLEPLARVSVRRALHGRPQFTADGRFVYWASRDGWITKFDLWNLKVVAEARAGLATRNLAVSSDGKVVMVANHLPHNLVALDGADLALVRVIPAVGKTGKPSSVSAVQDAPARASFVAALNDVPEAWEIPYDGRPVYKGLVHDYQFGEAIPEPGPLPVRTIALDDALDDFFLDPKHGYLIGSSRNRLGGQVIHLGAGRGIARLDLPGMPRLGAGMSWNWRDAEGMVHRVMALPSQSENLISVIDMRTWRTLKTIPTLGTGVFLRSHERSPYAWAGVSCGPEGDAIQVIDKEKLEVIATLRPDPGRTPTPVEFDRHGRYAMAPTGTADGSLVVYDARTLKEIRRLPTKRAVGTYNVWNTTRLSEGSPIDR